MALTYLGFWEYWQLYHKVTFDGPNKLILINDGETDIDVKVDIYSDWKEWMLLESNMGFLPAVRTIGGEPTVGNQSIGATFFLINGWKIRTWEGDQRLIVVGNLYSEDGSPTFVPTVGNHNILVNSQVSNLIDQINLSAPADVASAVWDKIIPDLPVSASYGEQVAARLLTLAHYLGLK